MKELIQFTYSYTAFKCDRVGANYGDGVYRMTDGADVGMTASEIIMAVRQDLPTPDCRHVSYGYIVHGDTPVFFSAQNRVDSFVKNNRPGSGPYYIAHVIMGDGLFDGFYPIELCGGRIENFGYDEIIDSERPEYYPAVSQEDLARGRNSKYAGDRIVVKQKRHIKDLALLADAVIAAMQEGKSVYLCAKSGGEDLITEWMAQLTMLFPRSIAEKITFNTYMPEPLNNTAGYVLCGAIDASPDELSELSSLGYVFEVGETMLTSYRPRTPSSLYDALVLCGNEGFEDWCRFAEDFCGERAVSMEEFLFAASVFKLKVDPDWDIADKIDFLNNNYTNPYNVNSAIQNCFMEISNDSAVQNRLLEDPALAFRFIKSMQFIISDSSISAADADEKIGLILFYMLECEETAHYIFERAVDQNFTFTSFFGVNDRTVTQALIRSAAEVKAALSSNFYLPENEIISENVLLAIIKAFMPQALTRGGEAREVLDLCASVLIRQNGMPRLFDILRSAEDERFVPVAQFLLELKNENGSRLMIEEDDLYCRKLLELLSSDSRFDRIIEKYTAISKPNIKVCEQLLKYKWADGVKRSFEDFAAMFEMRDSFRSVRKVFEERFIALFNASLPALEKAELSRMSTMSVSQLEKRQKYIESLADTFRDASNCDPRITDYSKKLYGFLKRTEDIISSAKRGEVSKSMRVSFIVRKLYQIPAQAIMRLLGNYDMISLPPANDRDFMKFACREVESFLTAETDRVSSKKKVEFCNDLDDLIAKHRMSYATKKSVVDNTSDILIGILLVGAFALFSTIVSIILFNTVANGYFSLIYKIFPFAGALFSGVFYCYNAALPERGKRIAITILESVCLLAVMLLVYHTFALII